MKHVSFDFYPRNASPFPFLKSKKKKVFIATEETRKLTSSTTSTNKPSFLFFKNGNLRVTNVFNFVKFFLSLWYRGFSLVVQVHHGFILFLPSYHPPNIRFTMVDHVKRWIVFSILRSALMLCMQFFLSEKKTKMKNIKNENKKKCEKTRQIAIMFQWNKKIYLENISNCLLFSFVWHSAVYATAKVFIGIHSWPIEEESATRNESWRFSRSPYKERDLVLSSFTWSSWCR